MRLFRRSSAFLALISLLLMLGFVKQVPTASAQTPSAATCCRCEKNGSPMCVRFTGVSNCSDLSGSTIVNGIRTSNASLLNGFTCTSLTATQCALVAQGGQCAAPPITEGSLQASLQSLSATGGETAGSPSGQQAAATDGSASVSGGAPLPSIVPTLSIPIPGVSFTPATPSGDGVDVPFLAQYISGVYKYLIGISVLVASIMVVFGGFKYVMGATISSVGDGKKIIQDAIGGLVVLLCSYLILYLVNPDLVNLRSIHLLTLNAVNVEETGGMAEAGSLGADSGEAAPPTGGPHSYCRENLRVVRRGVYCAVCGSEVPCGMARPTTPDNACLSLIGECGGIFGHFLDGVTEHCLVKRFDWLEGLDGGTFGILHFTENEFADLLNSLRTKDPAAYARVMAAGHNAVITDATVCAANRTNGGFVCNPDMQLMMRAALREPGFTKVQLALAYRDFRTRMSGASNHFHSEFGQVMWAIASNNPGSCGASFRGVIAACPAFSGNDENAKIECFLQQFAAQGCRGGVASATRRVTAIRHWLRDVSRVPGSVPSPPDLPTLEACIPS